MALLDFLASDPRQVWALDRATGAPFYIGEGQARGLREHARAQLRCPFPNCTGPITTVGGQYRRDHFRHLGDLRHPSDPESLHHIESKQMLAQWFREQGPPGTTATIEAAVAGTTRRADVLVTAPGARPLAVEVEYKTFAADDARLKHQDYLDAGVDCLWLLGHSRVRMSGSGSVGVPAFAVTLRAMGAPVLVVNPTTREIGTLLQDQTADWPWEGEDAAALVIVDPLEECLYRLPAGLATPTSLRLEMLVEQADQERREQERSEAAAAELTAAERRRKAKDLAAIAAAQRAQDERRRSLYAVGTRTRQDLDRFMKLEVITRRTDCDDAFDTVPEHWKAALFADCVADRANWSTFTWADVGRALTRHGVPKKKSWSSRQWNALRAFLGVLDDDGWVFLHGREFAASGRRLPEEPTLF